MICTAGQGGKDSPAGKCSLCGHPGLVHPNPANDVDGCMVCAMNDAITRADVLTLRLAAKIKELDREIAKQRGD